MNRVEDTHWINVNGKKLYFEHFLHFDSKPTLVFLHDSLGCAELWRDFPQKLSQKAQCNLLVYDRLGYGKSDVINTHVRPNNYMELEAEVVNDVLNQLNIKDVILFGHSDGGTIALLYASKYPVKTRGVIAEAAHIFVEEVTLKGIHDAVEAYNTTNLPERLAKYHGDKVETLFKAWTETWTRNDYKNWNIEHFLENISAPLLFIQGENDEYGTIDQVDKTVTQVKGYSEKLIIPKLGHTPHKENPELVLSKAQDFINKLLF